MTELYWVRPCNQRPLFWRVPESLKPLYNSSDSSMGLRIPLKGPSLFYKTTDSWSSESSLAPIEIACRIFKLTFPFPKFDSFLPNFYYLLPPLLLVFFFCIGGTYESYTSLSLYISDMDLSVYWRLIFSSGSKGSLF